MRTKIILSTLNRVSTLLTDLCDRGPEGAPLRETVNCLLVWERWYFVVIQHTLSYPSAAIIQHLSSLKWTFHMMEFASCQILFGQMNGLASLSWIYSIISVWDHLFGFEEKIFQISKKDHSSFKQYLTKIFIKYHSRLICILLRF